MNKMGIQYPVSSIQRGLLGSTGYWLLVTGY